MYSDVIATKPISHFMEYHVHISNNIQPANWQKQQVEHIWCDAILLQRFEEMTSKSWSFTSLNKAENTYDTMVLFYNYETYFTVFFHICKTNGETYFRELS